MKKLTRSETIAKNKADKRINAAYISTCSGIQVNIMDISKVFAHGNKLIAEGADDAALAKGVRAFVETIRADKPKIDEAKAAALKSWGYTVGPRDARLNRNYEGLYMIVEAHDESELPTDDGANGPWCIVGNDLGKLVNEAYSVWKGEHLPPVSANDNPYEHSSSEDGCRDGCRACEWEETQNVTD